MLNQLIIIHTKKFFSGMFVALCEKQEVKCYSLEDANDFAYLIDDLKPDAVIIDDSILESQLEEAKSNLDSVKFDGFKLMILGANNSGLEAEIIQKPIDPDTILSEIIAKLASKK